MKVPTLTAKIPAYSTFNLPILQSAVNEVTRNLQCPHGLALYTELSVACLAAQPLVNVRNPRGFVEPVSLLSLTVALSGEGKTAAEGAMKRVK